MVAHLFQSAFPVNALLQTAQRLLHRLTLLQLNVRQSIHFLSAQIRARPTACMAGRALFVRERESRFLAAICQDLLAGPPPAYAKNWTGVLIIENTDSRPLFLPGSKRVNSAKAP